MESKVKLTSCSINPRICKGFSMLTDEEMDYLEQNAVRVTFKRGENICKQGVMVSTVMYVEKGLVKVYMDDGSNTLVLKMIPDNNMLGLAAVTEEFNTHQYSASAYIETEVIQIEVNAFRELIRRNPDFAKEIIDVLSSNSVQIYGRFFCITHKQSFGRLADILLCLADRIFKKCEFSLPLSRQDLAELTGMSSETVIRTLKKFEKEGLIKINGKHFEVLDHDRLKQISELG